MFDMFISAPGGVIMFKGHQALVAALFRGDIAKVGPRNRVILACGTKVPRKAARKAVHAYRNNSPEDFLGGAWKCAFKEVHVRIFS